MNTQEKFIKILNEYKQENTPKNKTDEEAGYLVLDFAFSLFCMLENLADNYNSLKAQIRELVKEGN